MRLTLCSTIENARSTRGKSKKAITGTAETGGKLARADEEDEATRREFSKAVKGNATTRRKLSKAVNGNAEKCGKFAKASNRNAATRRKFNKALRGDATCAENSQRQLWEMQERDQNSQRQLREMQQREENSQRQLREMQEREENLQRQLREIHQREENSQRQLREIQQREENSQRHLREMQRREENSQRQLREMQRREETSQRRLRDCDWIIARHEIQMTGKCLGRGGWGSVYEGVYYYKSMILSPHNIRVFNREMEIASKCHHPHLLQFIGATNDEESPLFVTELMENNLRTLLELRQLSEREIRAISLDVARGLNYLHHKKPVPIIHRDVSSANVLLWRQGDQWRGKVSDYGTVNFMQQSITVAPGAMIYSAPEALTPQQTVKVSSH